MHNSTLHLLLTALLFAGNTVSAEPSKQVTTLLNGIRKTCYRCHGEPREDRTRVEGNFDLTSLLEKNDLSINDSATWLRVLKEVNTERMPPEDGREELSDEGRKYVRQVLDSNLNQRNLTSRVLTPVEIENDHSIIFSYNQEHYWPFETLKLQKLSESRYRTIDAPKLMSAEFLAAYQHGLEKLIRDYSQLDHEPYQLRYDKKLNFDPLTQNYTQRNPDLYSKVRPTGIAFPLTVGDFGDLSPAVALDDAEKQSAHFEMRNWKHQILSFYGMKGSRGLAPGRYQISFKAKTLDRQRVADKFNELTSSGKKRDSGPMARLQKEWQPLLHSKAILSFNAEMEQSHRKRRVVQPITEFVIEDNEERTYTHEFTFKTQGWIHLNFENGPAKTGRWKGVRLANELASRLPEYNFPRVQVRDMSITKLEHPTTRTPYDIAYLPDEKFSKSVALGKLQHYAGELEIPDSTNFTKTLYDDLPPSFTLREGYAETLKLLSMSNGYLYLQPDLNAAEAARHASYSLLKSKPTDAFKKNFHAFRAGSLSSRDFAQSILNAPEFEWFLDQFVNGWLVEEVDLDIEKYNRRVRALDLNRETRDYLNHLFTENRPIKEVFKSDYHVTNPGLAPYYGIEATGSGESQVYTNVSGGVLKQMAFLKSQSDGIDGLPFRRAKWILENVFGERMSNPPNDVNNEQFVAATELKTFKERTEFHSQQKGCYECHNAIDPLAFAFQHFDTLGELIAEEETEYTQALQARLDNSESQQVRAFATQLIQYVIGRRTTIYDAKVIEKFLSSHSEGGYQTKALLAHILDYYFK